MIISHRYKFIFLKTSKTAGTSIEIALSKFCDKNDIITPISKEDEQLRKELGYNGPQNYQFSLSEYNLIDYINFIFKFRKRRKKEFYNHISSKEIKTFINNSCWNSYYKFCFERNPWDKVVSQYYWKTTNPRPSIGEFLKSRHLMGLKKRGFNIYTINKTLSVNKVYKFEKLNESLKHIKKVLNLPENINLPKAKSKYRLDKRHYSKIFSQDERNIIKSEFEEEIKLFNYHY